MADEISSGVVITLRDMYNEIVGTRADVQSLTQAASAVEQRLSDHEGRLRTVERWKYGIPVVTLTAVASTVAAFLIH